MYVHVVPNRNSPPCVLLREGYREGGKVRNRTLANLSMLPPEAVDVLRRTLKGERLVSAEEAFEIQSNGSRPHGHVEAVLRAMRRLGFAQVIASRRSRPRDLVVAMVAARLLQPQSKLATTRWWQTTTLAEELGVGDATEDDLYGAMDWVLERQPTIEKRLAARHLEDRGLALYDLTSSYFEGVTCPLAALGHSRDGKKGKLQVNYGLLTDRRGVPVSVSVFEGNTSDSKTLTPEVRKVHEEFGIEHFVIVGDRGMILQKQIDGLRELEGVDWITALNTQTLRKLVSDGTLQIDLFDETGLFEVSGHPDFEGERLVACRNPALAERRTRKRRALLEATAEELDKVRAMVQRGRLRDPEAIRAALESSVGSKLGPYVSFRFTEDGDFELSVDEEGLVTAWTRTTRTELERLQGRVEHGKLKDQQAIEERLKTILGRRTVGRYIKATVTDGGFEVTVDSRALVDDVLAPLHAKLDRVRRRIRRGSLHGKAAIGVRVGRVVNKYKVAKHFFLDIRDDGFDFRIDEDKVAAEAVLDGVYVIRTSLLKERMDSEETVRTYKLLSQVERAFRSFKTLDLKVRPIHHNTEPRVRAHIFLCMLAYYVQWHMMEAWRPLLFADEDQQAKAVRDPVAPAQRSESASAKVHSKCLPDGSPAHSFHTLMQSLGALVRNICRRRGAPAEEPTFPMDTPPDDHQQRAYDLLDTITV
jgi:transposase